jgi:hypothetical protein
MLALMAIMPWGVSTGSSAIERRMRSATSLAVADPHPGSTIRNSSPP